MEQSWGIQNPAFNGVNIDYIKRIALTNPIRHWPLNDASGPSVTELIAGDDGTAVGVTWDQPGIGDGETSALFDGVNDYINIYSTTFDSIFNGNEGSVMAWGKVANAGVWSDGIFRTIVRLDADGSNQLFVDKSSANNQIRFGRRGGGTSKTGTYTTSAPLVFFNVALVFSRTQNQLLGYFNGINVFSASPIADWIGGLGANTSVIAAANITPVVMWNGCVAHVAVWDKPLTPAEVHNLYAGV